MIDCYCPACKNHFVVTEKWLAENKLIDEFKKIGFVPFICEGCSEWWK